MTRSLRFAVGASLLLAIAGCASKAPRQPPEPPPWVATGPCAGSVAELPITPLKPGKQALWQGDFRDAASCLNASGTAEPALLLALDSNSTQQELDVFLHIGKDFLLGAVVTVLNGAMQPLRSFGFDEFTARGSHFSLRLFQHPGSAPPAFVLVGVDPQAHGSDLDRITGRRVQTMWMAGGFMGSVADGIESRQRVAIRDTGRISLHPVVEAANPATSSPAGR